MDKVYEFLNLKPVRIFEKMHKNKRRPAAADLGDMLPESRRLLNNFFLPFNEALADLLGDKRFSWN